MWNACRDKQGRTSRKGLPHAVEHEVSGPGNDEVKLVLCMWLLGIAAAGGDRKSVV